MPIRYEPGLAIIAGHAAVEDAGDLAAWLLAEPARKVDLAAATAMHAAVLQCLMALSPELVAAPQDALLARGLAPVLALPSAPPAKPARRRRKAPDARRAAGRAPVNA